eukprot:m.38343 g.38343  ORF g.38343 m.38343 type:complete len:97 (+) comp11479_c0_seq2:182-472(+)
MCVFVFCHVCARETTLIFEVQRRHSKGVGPLFKNFLHETLDFDHVTMLQTQRLPQQQVTLGLPSASRYGVSARLGLNNKSDNTMQPYNSACKVLES